MPVEPIPEPTVPDTVWTFLNVKLGGWVVRRLNILFRIKVTPDGAGSFEYGEEGVTLKMQAGVKESYYVIVNGTLYTQEFLVKSALVTEVEE